MQLLTDTQRQWLRDPRNDQYRTELIEADHASGSIGLCTTPLQRNANDDLIYDPFLTQASVMDTSLSGHVAVGDFEAVNSLNPLEWDSLNFKGRECRRYYGDVRWPRAQFMLLSRSIIDRVPRDDYTFKFELVDRGFLLEKTIDQLEIDVSGDQVEIPRTFGVMNNAPGALVDYGHQIFQVHNGAAIVVQAYDNGVPVPFTAYPDSGKVKLTNNPVGTVSFDVRQTDNTALKIAQHIADLAGFGGVSFYGLAAWQRFGAMGLQVTGEPTYASILDEVAKSIGADWRLTAQGEIELVSIYAEPVPLVLTEDDILAMSPMSSDSAINTLKLHYRPNPTVLSAETIAGPLSGGVLSEFDRIRLTNPDVVLTQKSTADTGLIDSSADYYSLLVEDDDAAALMAHLMQRDGQSHDSYTAEMRSVAYGLRVGDRVELKVGGSELVYGIAEVQRIRHGADDALSNVELRL